MSYKQTNNNIVIHVINTGITFLQINFNIPKNKIKQDMNMKYGNLIVIVSTNFDKETNNIVMKFRIDSYMKEQDKIMNEVLEIVKENIKLFAMKEINMPLDNFIVTLVPSIEEQMKQEQEQMKQEHEQMKQEQEQMKQEQEQEPMKQEQDPHVFKFNCKYIGFSKLSKESHKIWLDEYVKKPLNNTYGVALIHIDIQPEKTVLLCFYSALIPDEEFKHTICNFIANCLESYEPIIKLE
jgi:hypothetical protein